MCELEQSPWPCCNTELADEIEYLANDALRRVGILLEKGKTGRAREAAITASVLRHQLQKRCTMHAAAAG